MIGAIIGDIVGSRFEWNNIKSKDFEFLTYKCFPTDDSIMTLALAQAILVSKPDHSDLSKNAVECMQAVGRNYPDCGYGGGFYKWMFSDDPKRHGRPLLSRPWRFLFSVRHGRLPRDLPP